MPSPVNTAHAHTPAAGDLHALDVAMPSVWSRLREDAAKAAQAEPILASHLHASVLQHRRLRDALSYHMAQKLAGTELNALQLREIFEDTLTQDARLESYAALDMQAVLERDPACRSLLQPFLHFKGYQALQAHRAAHALWQAGRRDLAQHLQSRTSQLFAVDIHPAARIGHSVMIDHATGVVIGETAVIGDGCSLLHGVTLGGTGKERDDRHPKIGRGVLIAAGAKVLGNIRVGDEARIAAGSVVLEDVEPGCTVAGVPARPVGTCREPARTMNQTFEDGAH
jgi:serine O-acetyltransferase